MRSAGFGAASFLGVEGDGIEVGGRHDLESFEVLRALDFTVPEPGHLVDAIALAQRANPDPVVLEGGPAARYINHLEFTFMIAPGVDLVLILAFYRPADLRDLVAAGARRDAEIAVLENFAQSRGPARLCRALVYEFAVTCVHRYLLRRSAKSEGFTPVSIDLARAGPRRRTCLVIRLAGVATAVAGSRHEPEAKQDPH